MSTPFFWSKNSDTLYLDTSELDVVFQAVKHRVIDLFIFIKVRHIRV